MWSLCATIRQLLESGFCKFPKKIPSRLDWVWSTAGHLCSGGLFSCPTASELKLGVMIPPPPPPSSQTLHVAPGRLRWQEQGHMPAPDHP